MKVCALAAVLLLAYGCAERQTKEDKDNAQRRAAASTEWTCVDLEGSCECRQNVFLEGTAAESEVRHCGTHPCCMMTETDGDSARCSCITTDECEAEVNSRRDMIRTDQCPPKGSADVSSCAVEWENCSPSYLDDHEFYGCCPGATCGLSGDGVELCIPTSTDSAEPAAAALSSENSALPPDCQVVPTAILAEKCSSVACHGTSSAGPQFQVDLVWDTTDLITRLGKMLGTGECADFTIIDSIDRDASLLLDKIVREDVACGEPMPPIGALTQAEKNCIISWVRSANIGGAL